MATFLTVAQNRQRPLTFRIETNCFYPSTVVHVSTWARNYEFLNEFPFRSTWLTKKFQLTICQDYTEIRSVAVTNSSIATAKGSIPARIQSKIQTEQIRAPGYWQLPLRHGFDDLVSYEDPSKRATSLVLVITQGQKDSCECQNEERQHG